MSFARLFVVTALLGAFAASAQSEWKGRTVASVGATIHLFRGKGQHFPGVKVFASGNIQGVCNAAIISYSLSVVMYTKTIGASLNPMVNDIQIDIINSINGGVVGGKDINYLKLFRTVGNGDFYNSYFTKEYGLMIGTNVIINNHRRNQVVGNVSAGLGPVTINYYNDGAPPISTLSIGDQFDRWWTGGLGIFFHTKEGYNRAEFSFDQFTGYMPQLYELSNMLGIDVPRYGHSTSTDKYGPPAFNTSTYKLRVFPNEGFGIDVGISGSLRTRNGKAYGLQEILHIWQGYALHPNKDIDRLYIGGTYIYTDYEK